MNLMHPLTLPLSILLVSACTASKPETVENLALSEGWVLEGFDAPESIIPDGTGNYFVSNVNGEGSERDGNGYISRISGDGAIIDKVWADGLNAPKGMALQDGTLYVSDIDTLVIIDVATSEIRDTVKVPDAAFFNDVAISEKGVFVTDSGRARIHRLEGAALPVWLEADILGGINGLLPQEDRLLVTTMSGGELLSIDWKTQTITSLVSGMENADGLGERPDGSFITSSWPGQIWHGRVGETPTLLLDTSGETPTLQNDILIERERILAPNWQPGTVREYIISTKP